MENQPPPAKRRDGEIAGSMAEEDRISQLPLHILHHHILSLLPQIEAVRTCILSKTWRYLGSTRPKVEFFQRFLEGEKQRIVPVSVLENTFQRYYDQKLSLHEFIFGIWEHDDCESIPILEKWIPIVLMNMGVKKLSLTFSNYHNRFPLPSLIFQSEFLVELHLFRCELNQNKKNCIIFKLRSLKRLELHFVYIEDETFEKMMSSCPLIQHLVLVECKGLSAIKVNKARNLKHFVCCIKPRKDDRIGSIEIDDDAPSLETIRIENCKKWYYDENHFFPRLKSLELWGVHLPAELLNNLSSNNCPCLEVVELVGGCSGFTEFKLSNRSIKRLIISEPACPIKADIDAANMLFFEYSGSCIPTVSFPTTSRECKSHIQVGFFPFTDPDVLSTCYEKLHEFLKALRQTQISLDTMGLPLLENQDTCGGGGGCEPVVVEHLCLMESCFDPNEVPALLNCLFRVCRPRYIGMPLYRQAKLIKSIKKILSKNKKTRQRQQDLEEFSIQVSGENTKEWHPCALSNIQSIWLRLKWRDLS